MSNLNIKSPDLQKALQLRLNYLYNLEPAQDNMFICSPIVPTAGKCEEAFQRTLLGEFADAKNSHHAQFLTTAPYRLYSASFDMPKIKVESVERMRMGFVSGSESARQFSLSWIEDCFHSIRKYHHDWFNCWYRRELDAFSDEKHGQGRFRAFQIYMYHAIQNENNEVEFRIWGIIDIADAYPVDLGKIELSAESGNSIYTCQYQANYIDLKFVDNRYGDVYPDKYDDGKSALQNMGFDSNEISRLKATFSLRQEAYEGGESFLH
jgi:hypothetical protein